MNPYEFALILIVIYFSLWMIPALIWKDNSIVDVVWGTSLIGIAWYMAIQYGGLLSWILVFLVTLSQGRLSMHIYRRKRNKKEDWRYANWRREWGKTFYWRTFLQIFLLQGLINWVMALPLLDISATFNYSFFQIIGLSLWAIGFIVEAIADAQMEAFRNNPQNKGQLMRLGLWRFSRHPNYFGQIVHWWGIFLLVSNGSNWWLSILAPIAMVILLTKVSGIPMMEAKYKDHPDYLDWIKETPALIPRIK